MLFQNKMFESASYVLRYTYEDDESMLYIVEMTVGISSSTSRRPTYNRVLDFVSCSCRLFDFK